MLDGALYCADCAPDHAEHVGNDGGGEADMPQHCDGCGVFLENPLTSDGYGSVIDALAKFRVHGRGDAEALEAWALFYGIEACDLLGLSGNPHVQEEQEHRDAAVRRKREAWEGAVASWNATIGGSTAAP